MEQTVILLQRCFRVSCIFDIWS